MACQMCIVMFIVMCIMSTDPRSRNAQEVISVQRVSRSTTRVVQGVMRV